jgi:hypothetical protein
LNKQGNHGQYDRYYGKSAHGRQEYVSSRVAEHQQKIKVRFVAGGYGNEKEDGASQIEAEIYASAAVGGSGQLSDKNEQEQADCGVNG